MALHSPKLKIFLINGILTDYKPIWILYCFIANSFWKQINIKLTHIQTPAHWDFVTKNHKQYTIFYVDTCFSLFVLTYKI